MARVFFFLSYTLHPKDAKEFLGNPLLFFFFNFSRLYQNFHLCYATYFLSDIFNENCGEFNLKNISNIQNNVNTI